MAIDARSGDIVWRESYAGLTYGGVSHANGVVFSASESGAIYARDAMSGATLWAERAPQWASDRRQPDGCQRSADRAVGYS